MLNKNLLILDLDETLIHATSKPVDTNWDFDLFGYKVYKRPYLDVFLDAIKDSFLVAVWSSASDDYVEAVVKIIFPENYPLEFVWGRSRCTYKSNYQLIEESGYNDPYSHYDYIKRLDKLRKRGYSKEKILIVDDTPRKSMYNYGNVIYPVEFSGQLNDDELYWLSKYLDTLKYADNVRTIEKRNWKTKIKHQP